MSSFVHTTIKLDVPAIQQKLMSSIYTDQNMIEIHQKLAEIVNPWVPYDTGNLSKDITVTAQGVTYNAPYAAKQYYGDEFVHNKDHHPLATSHWGEVAMQTQKDRLAKEAEIILKRNAHG